MTTPIEVPVDLPESPLIQLVDAWLYEVHLTRRNHTDDDPVDRPTLGVGILGRVQQERQPEQHTVVISADVQLPYNDNQATAELSCRVAGVFRIPNPDAIDLDEFTMREALLLVYPYLRSMVGQVWRMSGLNVPPLPTLDPLGTVSVLDENLAQAVARRSPPPVGPNRRVTDTKSSRTKQRSAKKAKGQ